MTRAEQASAARTPPGPDASAPEATVRAVPPSASGSPHVEVTRSRSGPLLTLLREYLDPAGLRAFAKSSPGRLIAIGTILIVLGVAAGTVTAASISERQSGLGVLLDDTEPDSNSALELYTSLSIADAAASTAFISGGLEPQLVRDRYSRYIGEAAQQLVNQSGHVSSIGGDSTTDPDTQLRANIATGLPIYTGLIETARANNRTGYPVGASYLSEASNEMQTRLLQDAQLLRNHRSEAVTEAQHHHLQPPWTAVVLLVVTLGLLVWAQFDLARRWRRLLNPGLLCAAAAILILLCWTVIAGALSAAAMTRGSDDGDALSNRLTESRILLQQARSAETLKLVRRDATGDYDRTYDSNVARLAELLGDYPASAVAATEVRDALPALDRWRRAHQRMNDTLERGDFGGAAAIATQGGAANSAEHVDDLDKALEQGIGQTRKNLRNNITQAKQVLDLLDSGAIVLGVAAAVGVGLGLWPRLREYR